MNCFPVLHFFLHHHILLINLLCLTAFTIQFGIILKNYINPEETNISVSDRNISTLPLVFRICFLPGFNLSAIEDAGYDTSFGSFYYFLGKSKYNSSLVGWAGHTSTSGVRGEVGEMLEKVTLHTVNEAIHEILGQSWTNDYYKISLTSVKLWRMNWPYNCFTLDLTNNTEVQQKGVRMISFIFPTKENTSAQ